MSKFEYVPGMFLQRRMKIAEARIAECLEAGNDILDLGGLRLYDLPESISTLKNLTSLDISDNGLGSLPEWIGELKNLTSLDVSDNSLTTVLKWTGELKNLTSLDISDNGLGSIPKWIGELKNLTSLNVGNSGLKSLPQWIGELKNLTSLDVSYNLLTSLPEWIGELKNLTSLDVSYNLLTSLPEWIGELKNFTSLNVRHSGLKSLPQWIGELKNLTSLDIGFNGLKTLPEWIGELKNLTTLDVSKNDLRTIPRWIVELENLTSLGIGNVNLVYLPAWIGALKNLTSLDVSYNRLTSLPESIGELKNLTSLNISSNGLKSLPEWIGELKNLISLNVGEIGLTALPEWIGELKNLTLLDLSYNDLTSLPERIGELKKLKSFDLSYNELESLPNRIGELKSLTSLNVRNNRLASVPGGIGELNLGSLHIEANPIIGVDAESLRSRDPDTLFEAVFAQDRAPLNEVRIILVGEGNAGKTSTRDWLVFGERKDFDRTEKIEIVDWKTSIEGQEINARVWDFGGQQVYQATHQYFLGDRSIYILLVNSRIGYAQSHVEKWLKTISAQANESRVIVLNNTYSNSENGDLNSKFKVDIPVNQLKREFPQLDLSFAELDCGTGDGKEKLESLIENEIQSMKFVSATIPRNWFVLKDKVADDKRPFLREQEFIQLCEGVVDLVESRNEVQRILNDLGIALRLKTREGLVILDPDWIIRGIYHILSTSYEETKNGIFTWNQLEERVKLLPADRYSAHDTEFLVRFMEEAKLCVRLSLDTDQSVLVPDLSRSEPEELEDWSEQTQLVYRFDQILEGLIVRLIVGEFGGDCVFWKTGFERTYEGRRARFQLNTEGKSLTVSVQGKDSDSRDALACAKNAIQEIHEIQPYRNVLPTIFVPHVDNPAKFVQYQDLLDAERDGESFVRTDGEKFDVGRHLAGVRTVREARMNENSVTQHITNNFHGGSPQVPIAGRDAMIVNQVERDSEKMIEEFIRKLRELDGESASEETRVLAESLSNPDTTPEKVVSDMVKVAKLGDGYKDALRSLAKGATDKLIEKGGGALTGGALMLPKIKEAWETIGPFIGL
jgi:internalin A